MNEAIQASAWVSCTCDECEGRGRFANGGVDEGLESEAARETATARKSDGR